MSPPGELSRARLESLYVELEPRLYNVVYRWIWEPEEAHEIVQEAFVRLWRMRARVRAATVEPLIWRICLNLARKRRRWRRLRVFVGLSPSRPAADADPEVRLRGAQRADRIREAVEALPEAQRQVVMLCHFSELSYREVAQVLQIPEGTVGSRRNAALARLRGSLGGIDVA